MSDRKEASRFFGLWEWAKGSPLKRAGLERLGEIERLQLARILSVGELSAMERKLVDAYRSPRDMAKWALAGVECWGLEESTAPMRAWARASALRDFLSGYVGSAYAANDWNRDVNGCSRASSQITRAAPSNAFTLLFKRRSLPGLAGAALLVKGCVSFPLLGLAAASSALGRPSLLAGSLVGAGVAKCIEVYFTSHENASARRELGAMRLAMASKSRVDRLAREALAQARELGCEMPSGLDEKQAAQEMAQSKKNDQEARALERKAEALSKGSALDALERVDEVIELKNKAVVLKNLAYQARESVKSAQRLDAREVEDRLIRFSRSEDIVSFAKRAKDALYLSHLKSEGLALRSARELEAATPRAQEPPSAAPRKARRI